jgi:hypothetical protein
MICLSQNLGRFDVPVNQALLIDKRPGPMLFGPGVSTRLEKAADIVWPDELERATGHVLHHQKDRAMSLVLFSDSILPS